MEEIGQTISSPSFAVMTPNDPVTQFRMFHLELEIPEDDSFQKTYGGGGYFPIFLVNESTSAGPVLVTLKHLNLKSDESDEDCDNPENIHEVEEIPEDKTSTARSNFVNIACYKLPDTMLIDVDVNLCRVAGAVVA